ncbi:MAG: urease accessory UreF family protein, partial [Oscillospiraceae bacterium]
MDKLRLLNMLQISDSVFPIGAFTLSNGLETLVQEERVTTPAQLERYALDYLHILPYNDLGAAALAFSLAGRPDDLLRLDTLLAASRAPSELRLGS